MNDMLDKWYVGRYILSPFIHDTAFFRSTIFELSKEACSAYIYKYGRSGIRRVERGMRWWKNFGIHIIEPNRCEISIYPIPRYMSSKIKCQVYPWALLLFNLSTHDSGGSYVALSIRKAAGIVRNFQGSIYITKGLVEEYCGPSF